MKALIDDIGKRIIGRITNSDDNYLYLAEIIELAGGGDHLEIGTLFGGSAILVALLKKELGHTGKVYCVDPLNGYYLGCEHSTGKIDLESSEPVCHEVLYDNLNEFGVTDIVEVIADNSDEIPEGMTFTTAYIDGNHWKGWPLKDWNNIKDITSKYVLFDDCVSGSPAVISACEEAEKDKNWNKLFHKKASFALERIT